MKKLKLLLTLITPLLSLFLFLAPVAATAATGATSTTNTTGTGITQSNAYTDACNGISQLNGGTQGCATSGTSVGGIISQVVNILSIVLGGIAIVMIIVSGIRFATSGGNSSAVSGAKKTLIYAVVGLVIAALAQVIIRWVLGTSSSLSSGSMIILPLRLY